MRAPRWQTTVFGLFLLSFGLMLTGCGSSDNGPVEPAGGVSKTVPPDPIGAGAGGAGGTSAPPITPPAKQ